MRRIGMNRVLSIAGPAFKEIEDRIIITINMEVIKETTIFFNSDFYHL
jgi:hypothetical protein